MMYVWQLRKQSPEEVQQKKKMEEKILAAHSTQSNYDELSGLASIDDDDEEDAADVAIPDGDGGAGNSKYQISAKGKAQIFPESQPDRTMDSPIGLVLEKMETGGTITVPDKSQKVRLKRGRRNSFDENHFKRSHPTRFKILNSLMTTLDQVVGEPFVYFAKRADPISLHNALQYIIENELSDNIYIVHFVDDREILNSRKLIRKKSVKDVTTAGLSSSDVDKRYNQLLVSEFRTKPEEDDFDSNFTLDTALGVLQLEVQQLIDTVNILDSLTS